MSYFDLNLDLSPEDEAIKDAARRFALEVLRPASIVIDKLPAADVVAPESPLWTCLAQAYELGYHKAAMPEEVAEPVPLATLRRRKSRPEGPPKARSDKLMEALVNSRLAQRSGVNSAATGRANDGNINTRSCKRRVRRG